MANKYWVGGTGTWDATNTANWSLTSGGAGGAAVPGTADVAIFNSASNVAGGGASYTVTRTATTNVQGIQMANPSAGTLTFAGSSAIGVTTGGLTISGTVNWTNTGTLTCSGTTSVFNTGTTTISSPITISGTAITVTLNGNVSTSAAFTLTSGTIALSTFTLTAFNAIITGTASRTLNFGTGNLTLTGGNTLTTIFDATTQTGLTVSGTPVINLTYAGSLGTRTIISGATATTFSFNVTAGTDTVAFTASNFVNNLNFTGFSGTLSNIAISVYGNITLSSGMTLTSGANTWTLTTNSHTITSAGKTIPFPVRVNSGNVTQADAFNCSSTVTTAATTFTWNTAGFSCTMAAWTNSAATTTFSNGSITVTGAFSPSASFTIPSPYTLSCGSIAHTGGTLTNNGTLTCSGTHTMSVVAAVFTNNSTYSSSALTHRAGTINAAAGTFTVSGAYTLQSNVTIGSATSCVLNLTTSISVGTCSISNQSNNYGFTIAFGTGTAINITGSGATVWDTFGISGVSFVSITGTVVINLTYAGSTGTRTINATNAIATTLLPTVNVTAGSDTVTFTSGNAISNVNFTGFSGTLSNVAISVYGNIILSSTMTLTSGTNAWTLTTNSHTITSAGETIPFPITVSSGNVTQADAFNCSSTVTTSATNFTWDTAGFSCTMGAWTNTVATATFSNGDITVTGAFSTSSSFIIPSPYTLSCSSATKSTTGTLTNNGTLSCSSVTHSAGNITNNGTLSCSGTYSLSTTTTNTLTNNGTFTCGTFTQTLGTVNAAAGTFTVTGTYNLNSSQASATNCVLNLTTSLTCDIFSINSISSTRYMTIAFGTGSAINITGSGATVFNNIQFGSASVITGTPIVNFTYAGSTGTRTVLTGPTYLTNWDFNITSGSDIFTFTASDAIGDVNFTGFSGTLPNVALTVYGNITLSTGMTLTSGISAWTLTTNSHTITSAGKTMPFPITVTSGNITQSDAFNCTNTITTSATATNFTWDTAGFSCTMGAWTNSASTTTFSNGDITVTGALTASGSLTVPSLYTLSCASLTKSSTGFTINGTLTTSGNISHTAGSLTNNGTLTCSGTYSLLTTATNTLTNNGTFTCATFTQTLGTVNASAGTFTVTGTYNLNSSQTSATNCVLNLTTPITVDIFSINSTASTRYMTIAFGTGTAINITGSGATVFNNIQFGGGSVITGTPIVNFTYAGSTGTRTVLTGATSLTGWTFNITSGSDIFTFTASDAIGDVNFTGFSGTLPNVAISVYGNLTLSSGMTLTSGTNALTLVGVAATTKTITSNGQTINFPVTMNTGAGGTTSIYQLLDNLTMGSTRTFTQTAGTLDLNGNTFSVGIILSSGNARKITSTTPATIFITATTSATVLSIAPSNFIGSNNITVNITGNDAVTKTVAVGSVSESSAFNYVLGGNGTTFNIPVTTSMLDLTVTNTTCTFNNFNMNIYGSFTNGGTSPTFNAGANTWTFAATSGTKTITSAGETFDFPITFNGAGGTWVLQDAMTLGSTRSLTLTNGTLDLNAMTLTVGASFVTATGTKNLTFNGGSLVCPAATTTAFNNAVPLNFTTTAGTGTGSIVMTAATAKTFVGGDSTFNCALVQGGTGALTISGSNTFLDIKNTTQPATVTFTSGTTTTVSSFSLSGTSGNLITINSSTPATAATLSKASGTVNVSYCNIVDSTATGGAAWYAANSTDGGGNTGWIFAALVSIVSQFFAFF